MSKFPRYRNGWVDNGELVNIILQTLTLEEYNNWEGSMDAPIIND